MAIINTRPIKIKPSPQTFALDKLLLPKPPKFKLYQNSIVRQSTSTYYRKYSYFANQLCHYKDEEKKEETIFFRTKKNYVSEKKFLWPWMTLSCHMKSIASNAKNTVCPEDFHRSCFTSIKIRNGKITGTWYFHNTIKSFFFLTNFKNEQQQAQNALKGKITIQNLL
jgi:hypothetical protein